MMQKRVPGDEVERLVGIRQTTDVGELRRRTRRAGHIAQLIHAQIAECHGARRSAAEERAAKAPDSARAVKYCTAGRNLDSELRQTFRIVPIPVRFTALVDILRQLCKSAIRERGAVVVER